MFGSSQQVQKTICQSCGLALSIHNFGTNASGSLNFQYCKDCFQKGGFTDPEITLQEMIQKTAKQLVSDDMNEEDAFRHAEKLIPTLKRWKNISL